MWRLGSDWQINHPQPNCIDQRETVSFSFTGMSISALQRYLRQCGSINVFPPFGRRYSRRNKTSSWRPHEIRCAKKKKKSVTMLVLYICQSCKTILKFYQWKVKNQLSRVLNEEGKYKAFVLIKQNTNQQPVLGRISFTSSVSSRFSGWCYNYWDCRVYYSDVRKYQLYSCILNVNYIPWCNALLCRL